LKTRDGFEMFLSADAEDVARQLYEAGASFTSGHRDLGQQASAMATNIVLSGNREWIASTYLFPGPLQKLVDEHPDATTVGALTAILHDGLHGMTPDEVARLSHHLKMPCDVFDLDPETVHVAVETVLIDLERQGKVTKVLMKEGGLVRFHVECASLPLNKVVQV